MNRTHSFSLAGALAALAILLPAGGTAQPNAPTPGASEARTTASVTLVLVSSLPAGPGAENARATIMRRATSQPQNLILVTRSTTAADLTNAISALFNSRRRQGDVITRDMQARIAPVDQALPADTAHRARSANAERPRNLRLAERQLTLLRNARSRHIEGVGTYPARVIGLGALRD